MAQKTNPIGLRLGINQVWDSTIQNYGKKHKFYINFLKKELLLNHFFFQHFKSNANVGVFARKCFVAKYTYNNADFIYNSKISQLNNSLTDQTQLTLNNISDFNTNIKLFYVIKPIFTANLFVNYAKYLFDQNLSLKKIINNLTLFLKHQLQIKTTFRLKNATKELNLIGFKLKVSGRFRNTRNRMAGSYEQSVGPLSLVCLKNVIEFHNQTIHTKLGASSLQIWLIYKN